MKIGDLSGRTGVPTRMLRYYEQQGLLAAGRSDNGYREFTDGDVDRVRTIRSLVSSGLPTRLIAIVLDMEDHRDRWTDSCTDEFASLLAAELRVLDDKIACLSLSRDTVRSFLVDTGHAARVGSAPVG